MNFRPAILVVDDEERIRRMLRLFLEREGFLVFEAEGGDRALTLLGQNQIDLVILDLMMPGMDGWTTCEKIRQKYDLPILMLTARGEEADRVLGFELGADDYVVKPFSPRELVLRVKALLRRTPRSFQGDLEFPNLIIDRDRRKVLVAGNETPLTPLEFDLLYFLAANAGKVFSRDQLLERVWGYDYSGDTRTVDTHIKRLREKLAGQSREVAGFIQTVWGVGYKFEVNQ